jgi:Transglycosylase SLT domain
MRICRKYWVYKVFCILTTLVVCRSVTSAQLPPEGINLKALFGIVGRMHNIDPSLLAAMAETESGNDPDSISPKGAMGLMQLMPATANQFSVPDVFDPVSNVLGAANFIDYLRTRIRADLGVYNLPELLAAYNAGPRAVERFNGIPPYQETQHYVREVLTRYRSTSFSEKPPRILRIRRTHNLPVLLERHPVAKDIQGSGDKPVLDQLLEIRRLRAQFQNRMRSGFAER